jgi:DNA invertase Pin-like site-specific DNA recombinase
MMMQMIGAVAQFEREQPFARFGGGASRANVPG